MICTISAMNMNKTNEQTMNESSINSRKEELTNIDSDFVQYDKQVTNT